MLPIVVVLPAYNEANSLPTLIARILKYTKNIVVVNDGSTDDTRYIAKQYTKVISLPKNLGKGIALRYGMAYALIKYPNVPYVATLDADGQHAPEDLPRLFHYLRKVSADIVIGERIVLSPGDQLMPKNRYLSNYLTSTFIKKLYGLSITDIQSGYRLFRSQSLKWILPELSSSKFQIETEIILEAWAWNMKIIQCPVQLIYIPYTQQKSKITTKDGFRWMWMTFTRIINIRKWSHRQKIRAP